MIYILRLIVDFGLLVLIWIIQLIIYPSFLYYKAENLAIWHKKYTSLITCIVGPLMLFQLGLTIYQITNAANIFNLANIAIISLVWLSTFVQFIPIHNNISRREASKQMLLSLVMKNWLRTILWTVLFLLSTIYCIFEYITGAK